MLIVDNIAQLIERASKKSGSQTRLAALLGIAAPTLIQMKQGKRPANWRIRGKLRAILGEDPAHAFIAAMAEDLEASEHPDERQALEGLQALLKAFPTDASTISPAKAGGAATKKERLRNTLRT